MVDDERAEHLAIRRVFPAARVALCWWHLKRAWLRHVPKDDPTDLEEALNRLLVSENEVSLTINLEEVRRRCTDKFWDYFISNYHNRHEMWVLYWRVHPRHNTNNYIESWHAVLKAKFLERKVQRRLNRLLHILLGDIESRSFLEDAQWASRSNDHPNDETGQLPELLRMRISGPMPVDDYIRAMSHEELVAAVLASNQSAKAAVAEAAKGQALRRQINSPRRLMEPQE